MFSLENACSLPIMACTSTFWRFAAFLVIVCAILGSEVVKSDIYLPADVSDDTVFDFTTTINVNSWSEARPYPISGAAFEHGNRGNIRLYQGKRGEDFRTIDDGQQTTITEITTRGPGSDTICPKHQVVTQMKCEGHNCEKRTLICSSINTTSLAVSEPTYAPAGFQLGHGEINSASCGPQQYVVGLHCHQFVDR